MARIKCRLCPEYLGADEIDEHWAAHHVSDSYLNCVAGLASLTVLKIMSKEARD